MDPWVALLLSLVAFVTAAFSAVVGMGGGITLLAAMSLGMPPVDVVPVHGIVQLTSNTSRTVVYARHAALPFVWMFIPGLVVGVSAGALLWQGAKLSWFKPYIGAFVLLFLVWRRYQPRLRNPPMWAYTALGSAAGLAGLFVGATGPLQAPFFLRDDLDKRAVVATKAACQTLVHLVKIPAFLALGYAYGQRLPLLVGMSLAVVAGTVVGKRLQAHLSEAQFVRAFELVLGVLGLLLLSQAFDA